MTRPTAEKLIQELAGAAHHMLAQTDGVRHFQQARMLFETALARHAAETRTAQDIKLLKEALDDHRRRIDNSEALAAIDAPFHHVLPTISRNPIFIAIHRAMSSWFVEVRNVTLRTPGSAERAYQGHKRICEAIIAGDPDEAAAAMRDHLEDVDRQYWNEIRRGSATPARVL